MEIENNGTPLQPTPRRKRRSVGRIFLESYLPVIIVCIIVSLFIVFAVNSIRRSKARREEALKESLAAEQSEALQQQEWSAEASRILAQAQRLAAGYDYDAAVAMIDSFSGNYYDYDSLIDFREGCIAAKEKLVVLADPATIPHLSFHPLIADPERAFNDDVYSGSFRHHHITVTEFRTILQQLYINDYVLVSLDDVFATIQDANGVTSYIANTIYLPEGKKPILITQTQPNYYAYMIDGNDDGYADKDGCGFASRLIVDADGNVTCEMIDNTGAIVTGSYDLVPILEEFISAHPDFSYRGARATLAVSGFEGLLGYRTNPETISKLGQEYYDSQLKAVPAVIAALKDKGYQFACYTYGNIAYGEHSTERIETDLEKWLQEVTPLLGATDILVYAKNSDISTTKDMYSGEKYTLLSQAGFHRFIGFCHSSTPWVTFTGDCMRQGRLMVTGNNLENNPNLFKGLFDASAVLDSSR